MHYSFGCGYAALQKFQPKRPRPDPGSRAPYTHRVKRLRDDACRLPREGNPPAPSLGPPYANGLRAYRFLPSRCDRDPAPSRREPVRSTLPRNPDGALATKSWCENPEYHIGCGNVVKGSLLPHLAIFAAHFNWTNEDISESDARRGRNLHLAFGNQWFWRRKRKLQLLLLVFRITQAPAFASRLETEKQGLELSVTRLTGDPHRPAQH